MNTLGLVNLRNPVNREHPLNQGLLSWWKCVPGLIGGNRYYDLLQLQHLSLTNTNWISLAKRECLQFTGTTSLAKTPNNLRGVSASMSYGGWFISSVPNSNQVLCIYDTWFANRFGVMTSTNTGIIISNTSRTSTIALTANTWTHLFVVQSGTSSTLYVNSKPAFTVTATAITDAGKPFYIGNEGSFPLSGSADDVRLYNRALSSVDVLALYNESLQNSPTTLNCLNFAKPYQQLQSSGPNIWNSTVFLSDTLMNYLFGNLNIRGTSPLSAVMANGTVGNLNLRGGCNISDTSTLLDKGTIFVAGKETFSDTLSTTMAGHILVDGKTGFSNSLSSLIGAHLNIDGKLALADLSTLLQNGTAINAGGNSFISSALSTLNLHGHLYLAGKSAQTSLSTILAAGNIYIRGKSNLSDISQITSLGSLFNSGKATLSDLSALLGNGSFFLKSGHLNLADSSSFALKGTLLTSAHSALSDTTAFVTVPSLLVGGSSHFDCTTTAGILAHLIAAGKSTEIALSVLTPTYHINIGGKLSLSDLAALEAVLSKVPSGDAFAIVNEVLQILRTKNVSLMISQVNSDTLQINTTVAANLRRT